MLLWIVVHMCFPYTFLHQRLKETKNKLPNHLFLTQFIARNHWFEFQLLGGRESLDSSGHRMAYVPHTRPLYFQTSEHECGRKTKYTYMYKYIYIYISTWVYIYNYITIYNYINIYIYILYICIICILNKS